MPVVLFFLQGQEGLADVESLEGVESRVDVAHVRSFRWCGWCCGIDCIKTQVVQPLKISIFFRDAPEGRRADGSSSTPFDIDIIKNPGIQPFKKWIFFTGRIGHRDRPGPRVAAVAATTTPSHYRSYQKPRDSAI